MSGGVLVFVKVYEKGIKGSKVQALSHLLQTCLPAEKAKLWFMIWLEKLELTKFDLQAAAVNDLSGVDRESKYM